MIDANETLERLKTDNGQFVANVRDMSALSSPSRRADLLEAQNPFAIIPGCSDSRIPAEIVFDRGFIC